MLESIKCGHLQNITHLRPQLRRLRGNIEQPGGKVNKRCWSFLLYTKAMISSYETRCLPSKTFCDACKRGHSCLLFWTKLILIFTQNSYADFAEASWIVRLSAYLLIWSNDIITAPTILAVVGLIRIHLREKTKDGIPVSFTKKLIAKGRKISLIQSRTDWSVIRRPKPLLLTGASDCTLRR